MRKPHLLTIIEPASKKRLFNFQELVRYKDLLFYMVLRDVTVMYKQTVLGFFWAILNPFFQIVVFSLIFGKIAGISTGLQGLPYPVFSSLAVIPWTYFASTFTASSNSLITTAPIFTKVYFPRIIIPVVPVVSKLADFFISLIILLGVMVFYKYIPGKNVWLFPLPLAIIIITSAGLGFWLSSLSLQYRDFRFAINFILPLLMYLAPVAYPAAKVHQQLGDTAYHLYALYPLVGGIEGFRSSFLQNQPFPTVLVMLSGLASVVIFISGALYFKKMEKHFADVA